MKEAFEDLQILKEIETPIISRLIDSLSRAGWPEEYDLEYFKREVPRDRLDCLPTSVSSPYKDEAAVRVWGSLNAENAPPAFSFEGSAGLFR